MPDHLHAIIAFPREPGMKTVITNWKKFVAVKLGVEWQRDFFDHRLRDHHELQEKTSYILMNPVRKGLCERMEDWMWVYRPADRPTCPRLLESRACHCVRLVGRVSPLRAVVRQLTIARFHDIRGGGHRTDTALPFELAR